MIGEYTKPKQPSRILGKDPQTHKQAPVAAILQAYSHKMSGKQPVQRAKSGESEEEEEAPKGYLQDLKTSNRWGGEPEAHAIATRFGIRVRIYRGLDDMDDPATYTVVGNGRRRRFDLYWNGNHYQVIDRRGRVVHDPTGDGSCMFEAMFFIVCGRIAHRLLQDPDRRKAAIRGMRSHAAAWLEGQPELLAVLEEEYEEEQDEKSSLTLSLAHWHLLRDVYKDYPPKDWYIEDYRDYSYFRRREGDGEGSSRYRIDYYAKKYINQKKIKDKKTSWFTDILAHHNAYKEKAEEAEKEVATEQSKEGVFATKYPGAIRIKPQDIVKKCVQGTAFADHMSFISSTFSKESKNLPRFDGHTVYHDTQGGKANFTIFGVEINGHRFLIAHGQHVDGGYRINWSCVPQDGIWGEGKIVAFGKTGK